MAAALRITYLPILPSSLTPSPTLTILTHTTISQTESALITTNRLPSMTTIVGLGPRAVSYTTIYITPTPSATASSTPEKPKLRDPVYGDLTWSYITLLCVPFIFLAFALNTNYRDRRRRAADQDIEMQPYKKYWFPWRELDPGEMPNEVSRAADVPFPVAAAAGAPVVSPAHGLRQKERKYAWHPSDETPVPPGRRHSWWEVEAYPSYATPLMPEREKQAAAAAADYHGEQIYGRTGSRRNAGPDESTEDLTIAGGADADSDNDSVTATTGRASPDISLENNVRNGGNANAQSPNPWSTHIPSYYGNLPFPVSPVSAPSPTRAAGTGTGSNNAGETQIQTETRPTPAQCRTDRRRNRFDFSDEDEANVQPAEPQYSYYADPSTRAGKQPAKP
ncbi:hypothetical protein CI238_05126 [Colletotrichum incanum]|uniref:Uncharacterized protein n=1 Tax=Colletotrichum incanum TaxID=1573173 RepID=A0A167BR15_COLIC|nr:hypothetical protein CI238_05126 [Colletotrichum incanum]OHW95199.1 hypothetical protein CSPAE12_06146 [Colletotrichum incanum]